MFFLIQVLLFVCAYGSHKQARDETWSYNNFAWPGVCSTGQSQSPIDIPYNVKSCNYNGKFSTSNFATQRVVTATNNGHSVAVNFLDSKNVALTSTYHNGTFTIDNIHFHWTSEHTLNQESFPMEIHLVFYNRDFGSVNEAIQHENQVSVVGILVEESDEDCKGDSLSIIANQMDQIQIYSGAEKIYINYPIRLSDFFPKSGLTAIYHGSLTTPACNEGVLWIMRLDPLRVCSRVIRSISRLYGTNGQRLTKTNRPVNPLNGRKVEYGYWS